MSELSEKILGTAPIAPPSPGLLHPTPAPKPKPKPPAAAPKPDTGGMFGFLNDPRVNKALHAAQGGAQTATDFMMPWAPLIGKAEGAVGNQINKIIPGGAAHLMHGAMNAIDLPVMGLGGAELSDLETMHQRHKAAPGTGPVQSMEAAFPHTTRFVKLIHAGKFDEANQEYSLVNLEATQARGKRGEALAKFFTQHPSIFGAAAAGAEWVNPISYALGEAGGAVMRGVSSAATHAGVNFLDPYSGMQRAAMEEATRRGATPTAARAAGQRARTAAINISNSRAYGRGIAHRQVDAIFKGLTKDQQFKLVDFIEGERSLPIEGSRAWNRMSPEEHAETALLQKRRDAYRVMIKDLDKRQVAAGLNPARLWLSENYAPRKGYAMDPTLNLSEEAQETVEQHRSHGTAGPSYRLGTAGQNIHRTYRTMKQALQNGVQLNPDWRFSDAVADHIGQRESNIRLEEGLRELQDLKLIDPRGPGARPDYLPFTKLGDLRGLGAPTTREGVVHPEVGKLLTDLNAKRNPLHTPLTFANQMAAKTEVTNPVFHPLWNLSRNYFASGGTLPELFKAFTKGPSAEAEAAGATLPYHSQSMPSSESVLSFNERPGKVKDKVVAALGHAVEHVSNKPVYGYAEPRMGTALYNSLIKKGMSKAEAVEATRTMQGAPEALSAMGQRLGQGFMFPSWTAAMAKFWTKYLIEHPQAYMAPHRGVEAHNEAYGVRPRETDYATVVPPIALSKASKGKPAMMMSVPHPGNRVLSMLTLGTDLAGGQADASMLDRLMTFANPALQTGGRVAKTVYSPSAEPGYGILWDKDAPTGTKVQQAAMNALAPFTPTRMSPLDTQSGVAGLGLGALGLSGYPRGSKKSEQIQQKIDTLVRRVGMPGASKMPTADIAKLLSIPSTELSQGASFSGSLDRIREIADKLRRDGYPVAAKKFDLAADKIYDKMERVKARVPGVLHE